MGLKNLKIGDTFVFADLKSVLKEKGLHKRQMEIVDLVAKGLSNKEIANQLFINESEVTNHLPEIYRKMGVKSRAQLIVWCLPHLGYSDEEAQ